MYVNTVLRTGSVAGT